MCGQNNRRKDEPIHVTPSRRCQHKDLSNDCCGGRSAAYGKDIIGYDHTHNSPRSRKESNAWIKNKADTNGQT